MNKTSLSVIIAILSLVLYLATALDTISSSQPLTQNQTIVSSGQVFELGFFSPGNSNKWFIGIWYKNISSKIVVWVANRDNPLSSSSGTLKIDNSSQNLILADESGKAIWQLSQTSSSGDIVAQILDTGNFVLRRENDLDPENYFWQSFDHPTDTLLPGSKLGFDKKTGRNRLLTSWKNKDDPSTGDYVFKVKADSSPEILLWQNEIEVYRSGPWNGTRFSGMPENGPISTFFKEKDEDAYSFKTNGSSKYSRLLVNSFGVLQRLVWVETRKKWNVLWYAPSDQCDTYRECGSFGICDTNNSTICQCLNGFEPQNKQEWEMGDGSGGCARMEKLNCRNDGFISMKNVKFPESSNAVFNGNMSLADCKRTCQRNCSCTAYASMYVKSGCVIWVGELVDLRQYSEERGGQELFVKVPKKRVLIDEFKGLLRRIIDHLTSFLELWDLRIVILLSLLLQIILIFLAPFRKRVSSGWLSTPMWFAYLLADITATYALGIISKSQILGGTFSEPNLLALWAPFILVHLGGPDTITAFALEDNELWLRHLLNLGFHFWAVSYSFLQSIPNRRLWLPTLLMIIAGLIKYTERTRSLYLASTRRFRNSLLTDPDPGPNYAKLMDEYSSKMQANLPTKIEMIPEPKRDKSAPPEVKPLKDLQIVLEAHDLFDKFKGLISDMIFSFRERTDSRNFFLQRNARDAFKIVEVELNFIYDVLFTKVVVVQHTFGYILRFASIALTCASLMLFTLFNTSKVDKFDIAITYTLLIGAIALDAIAFIMALTSDWTAVALSRKKSTAWWAIYLKFNSMPTFLGTILCIKRDRWPAKKPKPEPEPEHASYLSNIMTFVAKFNIFEWYMKTIRRRWSESIDQYNVISYVLNPRNYWLDKAIGLFGLTNMADSWSYVKTKPIDDDIRNLIFEELKTKAEVADDLETSKEINSARGDWILRFHTHYNLLPWVNDVDFDESVLLWHVATDLLLKTDGKVPTIIAKANNSPDYRTFSKRLSGYMLYLLMMQPTMMSTVAGIGEIRFRDTCAEAEKFFKGRDIKKGKGDKPHPHAKACESLLGIHTAVKPVAVKGDRSKSVLFDACMLAKELKKLGADEMWKIISKVWVELLGYAASRCRASTHAAELSKGGQFMTLVWLLMAHFGLGSQFQISAGHARAKLIVGK